MTRAQIVPATRQRCYAIPAASLIAWQADRVYVVRRRRAPNQPRWLIFPAPRWWRRVWEGGR